MTSTRKNFLSAIAAAAMLLGAAQAQALVYDFSQSFGAASVVTGNLVADTITVSGQFSGTDGVGGPLDGTLTAGEITFLTMNVVGTLDGLARNLSYVLTPLDVIAAQWVIGDSPMANAAAGTGSGFSIYADRTPNDTVFWRTGPFAGYNGVLGGGIKGELNVFSGLLQAPNGYSNTAAQNGGTLVTVVPEPQTYLMMLAGLAVFGFAARRRAARA